MSVVNNGEEHAIASERLMLLSVQPFAVEHKAVNNVLSRLSV